MLLAAAILVTVYVGDDEPTGRFRSAPPCEERRVRPQTYDAVRLLDPEDLPSATIGEVPEPQREPGVADDSRTELEIDPLTGADRPETEGITVDVEPHVAGRSRPQVEEPPAKPATGGGREVANRENGPLLRAGDPVRGSRSGMGNQMTGPGHETGDRHAQKRPEHRVVEVGAKGRKSLEELLHLIVSLLGGAMLGSGCGRLQLADYRSDRVIACAMMLCGLVLAGAGVTMIAKQGAVEPAEQHERIVSPTSAKAGRT